MQLKSCFKYFFILILTSILFLENRSSAGFISWFGKWITPYRGEYNTPMPDENNTSPSSKKEIYEKWSWDEAEDFGESEEEFEEDEHLTKEEIREKIRSRIQRERFQDDFSVLLSSGVKGGIGTAAGGYIAWQFPVLLYSYISTFGSFTTEHLTKAAPKMRKLLGIQHPAEQAKTEQYERLRLEYELNLSFIPREIRIKIDNYLDRLKGLVNQNADPNSAPYLEVTNFLEIALALPYEKKALPHQDLNSIRQFIDEQLDLLEDREREEVFTAAASIQDNAKSDVGRKMAFYLRGAPATLKSTAAKILPKSIGAPFCEVPGIELTKHPEKLLGSTGTPSFITKCLINSKANPNRDSTMFIIVDDANMIFNLSGPIGTTFQGELLNLLDPDIPEFQDGHLKTPVDISNVYFVFTSNETMEETILAGALGTRLRTIVFKKITRKNKIIASYRAAIKEAIYRTYSVFQNEKPFQGKIRGINKEKGRGGIQILENLFSDQVRLDQGVHVQVYLNSGETLSVLVRFTPEEVRTLEEIVSVDEHFAEEDEKKNELIRMSDGIRIIQSISHEYIIHQYVHQSDIKRGLQHPFKAAKKVEDSRNIARRTRSR